MGANGASPVPEGCIEVVGYDRDAATVAGLAAKRAWLRPLRSPIR